MATIGTFTKTGESFTGAVKTLSINAKTTIKPADKTSDKAPDYRVFAGSVEFGAAWKKTSTRAATISRSSWTTQASPPRSTPPWSRARTTPTP